MTPASASSSTPPVWLAGLRRLAPEFRSVARQSPDVGLHGGFWIEEEARRGIIRLLETIHSLRHERFFPLGHWRYSGSPQYGVYGLVTGSGVAVEAFVRLAAVAGGLIPDEMLVECWTVNSVQLPPRQLLYLQWIAFMLCILLDSTGHVHFTTLKGGIVKYDLATDLFRASLIALDFLPSWLEARSGLLLTGAAPTPAVPRDEPPREILERMALAELLIVGPNGARIARKVGVPRTTLMGWPRFRENYNKAKEKQAEDRETRRRRLKSADEDDRDDE